ncbi:MAG: cbb3-type cytochrome c oxidase subunit I [Gorillibacterium sp.]|nr:cbb3-type cytochrome c oxidase subunit I [Gorillibacterium sp.]
MFRLPFLFIITGIISFALFQIFSLLDLATWLSTLGDWPRYPTGWSRVHLLVLGWATMIAMGAVYQLIPVVLQNQSLYSRKLGFVHYGFFAVGTAGLLIGFQTMLLPLIASFATLAFIGILLFAINLGITLYRAKKWNTVTISAACAVSYLVLAGLSGMLMGLNFYFDQWGSYHDQLFGAHLWFGAIGWFGLLITGFSYKMLPMFYLSHGHPEKLQKVVIGLWNAGVLVGASSFLFNAPGWVKWSGLLLIVLALITYSLHLSEIYQHRHKLDPGAGMKWTQNLARGMTVVAILVLVLYPFFPEIMAESRTYVIMGWIYLWGFIGLTLLSYLSKIIPFLWWTHKYGPLIGKGKIPTMADLINDRVVNICLTVIVSSLFVVLLGLGWNQPIVTSLGGSLLALSSLYYAGTLARVFLK